MEKLSRVKKYAELRKSIETDNNIDKTLHTEENGALEQEETLKKFDSSIFKKVDIKEDGEYTPVREKKEEPLEQPPVDDTFTNEYLDDFIKEVREYNIRKGTRESDNTQADILYQLNAANRAKRSHYIQEIQDEPQPEEPKKTVLSRDDIAPAGTKSVEGGGSPFAGIGYALYKGACRNSCLSCRSRRCRI